jgi:hypothetical protein
LTTPADGSRQMLQGRPMPRYPPEIRGNGRCGVLAEKSGIHVA